MTVSALGVCRVCKCFVTQLWMQSKTAQQHEQNSFRQQNKAYYALKGDCSTSRIPTNSSAAMPNGRQPEPRLATVPTKSFSVLEKEEIKQNQSKNIFKSSSLWKRVGKKLLEPSTRQREGARYIPRSCHQATQQSSCRCGRRSKPTI